MDPSAFCVIFVPGAWHPARLLKPVGDILELSGFNTDYVDLPSLGNHLPDLTPDVEAIRASISRAASKGQKVILFAHSYGGIPSAEVLAAFGPNGAVAHFVLCCAFIIPKGLSGIATFGGQSFPPWWSVSEDELLVEAMTPETIFYNDCSPDQIAEIVPTLKAHSLQVFDTPLTYEGWRHIPTTYIYCTLDAAIPIHVQKLMVEGMAEGAGIKTEELNASHSPYLSMPGVVASLIQKVAK